jgi:hypothetical protein
MPTLAELTLQLSRDITRNEHERARALAAVDDARLQALTALPGATVPLRRHAEALAKAQADRDETLLDIEADLREAERRTADRRVADEDEAEQRLRQADDDADEACRAAEGKARTLFEAAVLTIDGRDLSPGEKVLARSAARRTLDRALGAAQETLAAARLAHQDRLLDERRTAVSREMSDSRENRATAAARRTAASNVFALAVDTGDEVLRAALAAVPGAAFIIEDFSARRREVDRRFAAQEAALHEAFREARGQLRPA